MLDEELSENAIFTRMVCSDTPACTTGSSLKMTIHSTLLIIYGYWYVAFNRGLYKAVGYFNNNK